MSHYDELRKVDARSYALNLMSNPTIWSVRQEGNARFMGDVRIAVAISWKNLGSIVAILRVCSMDYFVQRKDPLRDLRIQLDVMQTSVPKCSGALVDTIYYS